MRRPGVVTKRKIGRTGSSFLISCFSFIIPQWHFQNPYRLSREYLSSRHEQVGQNLYLNNLTVSDSGNYYCRGTKGHPEYKVFYARVPVIIFGNCLTLILALYQNKVPISNY